MMERMVVTPRLVDTAKARDLTILSWSASFELPLQDQRNAILRSQSFPPRGMDNPPLRKQDDIPFWDPLLARRLVVCWYNRNDTKDSWDQCHACRQSNKIHCKGSIYRKVGRRCLCGFLVSSWIEWSSSNIANKAAKRQGHPRGSAKAATVGDPAEPHWLLAKVQCNSSVVSRQM